MSRILQWFRRHTAGELLILKAIEEFAVRDYKTALGNLLAGLEDLAEGTAALGEIQFLRIKLGALGVIPPPLVSFGPEDKKGA